MESVKALCQQAPVIPVLVVDDVAQAQPLARALVAGGLPVLEVTLRTPAALDVIKAMSEVEGAIVGAGTVITADDVRSVRAAGARFAVSPGSSDALLTAAANAELPLLPGAVTASEVMNLLDKGYEALKFFPAEAAGGVNVLKSLHGPLPQASFCPTGGVSPANAAAYLNLPNVLCVGGSWVVPKDKLQAGDWDGIQALAFACQGLKAGAVHA